MGMMNSEQQYGVISKLFHWSVFLVLIALIITAEISEGLPRGPEKLEIITLHASFGLLMLILMVLRVSWRWINPVPAAMSHVPTWQNRAAYAVHIILYLAIIIQALSGVIRAATVGFDLPFFGLFQIPIPIEENEALNEQAKSVHGIMPYIFISALVLHILAAFYHHFKLKDNTLRRMTFGMREE